MFLLRLAFKNIFRHKIRTIISIIVIGFAVMIVIFSRGFINGMIHSLYSDSIQYNSGHVHIMRDDYYKKKRLMPLDFPINGYEDNNLNKMITSIENIEDVKGVIYRLKFGSMISTGKELITLQGWGINPKREIKLTNIKDRIVEGRMVQSEKLEVVMGTELLNKIDSQVGDNVTILFNTSYSSLKGVTFRIVGRIESGLKLLDENVFYLPLKEAQRLLYMEDQVTEMLVMATGRNKAEEVQNGINNLMKENNVQDKYLVIHYEDSNVLLSYLNIAQIFYNQIYFLFVILASVVLVSTMIMIVKERTKEIGMMLALGLKEKGILKLFILEGSIIGLFGSSIGAVVGHYLSRILSEIGIDVGSAVNSVSFNIMFNKIIYPTSSIGNSLFAFFVGIIIVILVSVIPARRAAKLEPTEAMKE